MSTQSTTVNLIIVYLLGQARLTAEKSDVRFKYNNVNVLLSSQWVSMPLLPAVRLSLLQGD